MLKELLLAMAPMRIASVFIVFIVLNAFIDMYKHKHNTCLLERSNSCIYWSCAMTCAGDVADWCPTTVTENIA
jgi:hypothetical protein